MSYYDVVDGDTMEGVALRTGIRVSQLRNLNNGHSQIFPGQRLTLKNPLTPAKTSDEFSAHPELVDHHLPEIITSGLPRVDTSSSQGILSPLSTNTVIIDENEFGDFTSHTSSQDDKAPSIIIGTPELNTESFPIKINTPLDETSRHGSSCDDLASGWAEVPSVVNLQDLLPVFPLFYPQAGTSSNQDSTLAHKDVEWKTMLPQVMHWFTGEEAPHEAIVAHSSDENEIVEDVDEIEAQRERDQINRVNLEAMLSPPSTIGISSILTVEQMIHLRLHFPLILRYDTWYLLYSVLKDGADLVSFFKLVKGSQYTLIVIETTDGEILGGFTSEEWGISKEFYGSGECFVYCFDDNKVVKYTWSQNNDFSMYSNHEKVGMGGGGEGFAFVLDSDFYSGGTYESATYGNKKLAKHDTFLVKNVEIWGFDAFIKPLTKSRVLARK
jgi:LysM repeat protein